ncbi:MAG: type IV pilus modification protein PilV [Pseudomonadales bacterium]|nr:type IV pilus modification protein PilV [Pseudomonadales bacterium]
MKQCLEQRSMKQQKQAGVGMIEILVTLLVLGIGLMGVVGMQYMSLKSANDANNRYLAALYTQELVERMRSNQVAVQAGNYSKESNAGNICTKQCTPQEMARSDIKEWLDNIENDLPNGEGKISVANVGGSMKFTLTVTWDESDIYQEDDASDVVETSYILEVTL